MHMIQLKVYVSVAGRVCCVFVVPVLVGACLIMTRLHLCCD